MQTKLLSEHQLDQLENASLITCNSMEAVKDSAFFCIVGENTDGHDYISEAVKNGAKFVVSQRDVNFGTQNAQLFVVDDTKKAFAQACYRFYKHQNCSLNIIGITGTNGKTTCTFLLQHIFNTLGKRLGVIGTTGIYYNKIALKTKNTTPMADQLFSTLLDMQNAGLDSVAIEVSSHALALDRVWGLNFSSVAFLNLTQDHLDYHNTIEQYFEAKSLLFSSNYPAKRAICINSEYGVRLANMAQRNGDEVITFGFEKNPGIYIVEMKALSEYTQVKLCIFGTKYELFFPLVGKYNLENMMCVIAISLLEGLKVDDVLDALSKAPQVRGRMERVECCLDKKITAFIDYAHTPDALDKAISALKQITIGKVIVVFGCGGNRDRTKRPIMGEISQKAGYVVVTSDNPRNEDPGEIISDIVAAMSHEKCDFEIMADRGDAIRSALSLAGENDSVLIAGKGHEDYQIIGDKTVHFDDREVCLNYFSEMRCKTC